MNPNLTRRIIRRIAEVIGECNYAQRRMFALMTSPDRYRPDPDRAPETYPEFLFRASGGLLHEPAPAERRSWPGNRLAA